MRRRKSYAKYTVTVRQNVPSFTFYAPNADVARFYTEMCGYAVKSVRQEKST